MADDASPSRLLLASCHSQHYAHVPVKDNIWDAMRLRNASGLLWVGDAIYGDDYDEQHHVVPATPAVLQSLYQELLHDNAGYRRFRDDAAVTVLGAWDDHDYGVNNGDRQYQFRLESAAMFLDFLRRSNRRTDLLDLSIMERRAQAGRGLYGVKVLDFRRPRGQELLSDHEAGVEPEVSPLDAMSLSDRSVAVFLIDCRSNKTPWQKKTFADTFLLDYEGDFLGEEQWRWLETALQRSTATVNLIVQGLQVHADRYFDGNLVEDWSSFPKAQHRLYQAILSSGVQSPVLVSGDVHMAELLRRDCRQANADDSAPSRMLLEVTVSGMTHSWCSNICPRPQSGILCRVPWFQWALCMGMRWAHHTSSWSDLVDVPTPYEAHAQKRGRQYALQRNFGELEFDWEAQQVIVRVLDPAGDTVISTAWPWAVLSGTTAPVPTGRLQTSDFAAVHQRWLAHNVSQSNADWICLNHGGVPSTGVKLYGVVSSMSVAVFIMFLPLHVLLLGLWMIWRRYRLYQIDMKVKTL